MIGKSILESILFWDWAWWCMPVITATWEADIGGLWLEVSPAKKLASLYHNIKPGIVIHAGDHSYSGSRGRRIMVCDWLRQKCKTLCEKQTKSKKSEGMAEVVEYLPSKWEAMS
jgi:hypothetical protein